MSSLTIESVPEELLVQLRKSAAVHRRSLLALYLRQQHLRLADALLYMSEAEVLLHGGEYQIESIGVLELAERSGCSSYGCEFVHLAQKLGAVLVTSDKKLLRIFPEIAVSPNSFVG